MKRIFHILLALIALSAISLAQNNDCGNNAGFESGTVTGWLCKSGYYGANPCPPSGTCPRMGTIYTSLGQLNSGGINAGLTSNTDRHVIMTGAGTDPNSGGVVPVVAPGGGTYSFRLGNSNTGAAGPNNTSPLAEAIRLSFLVKPSNAGFSYKYAFFVANPGHTYESQPGFEVVVLDSRDSIIPCGRYFVVAGNYPACVNASGFVNGNNGYVYKNWTTVGLDLTPYIGQNISVEFRTTDCEPAGGGSPYTTCSGPICTYCTSPGNCCTYPSGGAQCTPPPGGCTYTAGTHSAYAYIDAFCSPVTEASPAFCAGAASITICAPFGYQTYSWPAGQPGLAGSPTTQCVTINNPVSGTTYTVTEVSATGCSMTSTITLQGTNLQMASHTICTGTTVLLTTANGTNYSWSTGATTASIAVSPLGTTTYSVSVDIGGCTATGTSTVTVISPPTATVTSPVTVCGGSSATLTAGGGGTYSWSTGQVSSAIVVTPSITTGYCLTVTTGNCSDSICTTVYACLTDIQNISSDGSFTVYPNPTSGIITIKSETSNISSVEIFNVFSEKVFSADASTLPASSHQKADIDLTQRAKGIYFYKVRSEDQVLHTGKIIVD